MPEQIRLKANGSKVAHREAVAAKLKAARSTNPRGTKAIKFLQQLAPDRPWWTLTAIEPDGKVVTESFEYVEEARRFIADYNGDGYGIYYSLNTTKTRLRSKARKDDIAAVEYLHVDADPNADETPDDFKARLLPKLDEFRYPPTFVVDSGNGLQLLWRLRQAVPLTDDATIADIEARNHALAEALGAAPSTRNVDRILRVPGTTNYPNEPKRKQGRVECPAKLLEANDHSYDLGDFPPKQTQPTPHQPGSSATVEIPRNVQAMLYLSGRKGESIAGYKSRSGLLWGFLTSAIHARVPDSRILDALLDGRFTGNAIYEHVVDEGGREYAERQLNKARSKVADHGGRAGIHSWEQPDLSLLDDRRGDLPTFPLDTLQSQWLIEWVEHKAHSTGTTVDHVAVPLLGVSSSMIGNARRVVAKSWSLPMTLWTALIGLSGTGKTPGMDAVRDPLAELEYRRGEGDNAAATREHAERVERAKVAHKRWQAAVKEAIDYGRPTPPQPADAEKPADLVLPRLYAVDATIERIAVLLQARPQGMLLMIDELAGWFHNMSRYSGGRDDQFWLMAWDGKLYSVERMGRPPLTIPHLLIGVTGGLQPDKLADVFKGAADGMSARFLYAWPPSPAYRPLTDAPETDEDMMDILDKLDRLAETASDNRRLPLTEKALEALERYRKTVHAKAARYDGREQEWWRKSPAQVLRLAGTLALLKWAVDPNERAPQKIPVQYVTAASKLVREYFWRHARAAMRQIGLTEQNADARQVLRWIVATGKTQIAREQVRRDALRRNRDANQTQAVLDALVQAGWLREQRARSAGRPMVRWDVNPLVKAQR
jgi:hypothetical protein